MKLETTLRASATIATTVLRLAGLFVKATPIRKDMGWGNMGKLKINRVGQGVFTEPCCSKAAICWQLQQQGAEKIKASKNFLHLHEFTLSSTFSPLVWLQFVFVSTFGSPEAVSKSFSTMNIFASIGN